MPVLVINGLRGPRASPGGTSPLSSRCGTVPRFLVPPQPFFRGRLGDLLAVLKLAGPNRNTVNGRLAGSLVESRAQIPKRALLASLLLHSCVIVWLIQFPRMFPGLIPVSQPHSIAMRHWDGGPLIYRVVPVRIVQSLPALRPAGPGGHPGKGVLPDRLPPKGSSVFHSRMTIVSNPAHPDNSRQTIVQPNTPPDLRIEHELRLPNILSGSFTESPKLEAEVKLSAPRAAGHRNEEVLAPEYIMTPQELSIPLASATVAQPRLPVPVASSLAAPRAHAGAGSSAEGVAGADASDAAARGLLVVSVDPADSSFAGLLPGNRFGAFSISPSGGLPGSPGGVPGRDIQGGSGGPGTGGDSSTGIGSGKDGGGGGGISGGMPVSISGGSVGTTGSASAHILSGGVPLPIIVYAIPMQPELRKPGFVLFTGPIGGAGLNVYGVLHCRKIYTMYLPMPGKQWVMEYCASGTTEQNPPEKSAEKPRQIMMHADAGLAPPAIQERYDFKRPPVAAGKTDKLIILRGAIEENGTVTDAAVYQGVIPEADQAAREAFSRWRFKPALREGKPIRVEILVGIPVSYPQ